MTKGTFREGGTGGPIVVCSVLLVSMMAIFGSHGASGSMGPGLEPAVMNKDMLKGALNGPFIENGGQWDGSVIFAAMTSFGHIAFCRDSVLLNVKGGALGPLPMERASDRPVTEGTVIKMEFEGANGIDPIGSDVLPYRTNILRGKDPSKWGKGLLTCNKVVYHDLWDGIDLVYTSNGPNMKYEYTVEPWADPSSIRFRVSGAMSVGATDDGIEMITSSKTRVLDDGLVSFYKGSPVERVVSSFRIDDDGTIGFDIVGRDRSRAIVIDPIIYSTFLGGTESENIVDMVMDGDGACYLAGNTYSFDFPVTPGAYNAFCSGEMDGFVLKVHPNGSAPVFSTYIGGGMSDYISSLDIDTSGNIYIAGHTTSQDYPTTSGAFNETLYGMEQDLVVSKLDPSGSDLLFSTYLGGNGSEAMDNRGLIDVDSSGCVHVAGTSWSGNFPVTDDAFDGRNDEIEQDGHRFRNGKVVLVKLGPTGSDLVYSSYIGGTEWDTACGLEIDQYGKVYVMGSTSSRDFPLTPGAFDTTLDSWSAVFVLKFDMTGSCLDYSTLIDGTGYQMAKDLIVDGSGKAYIVGDTSSSDFPVTEGAYQRDLNGWADIFVTALDPTGSSLHLSTFIGGSDGDQGYGIDLDPDGGILITGSTWSFDFPQVVLGKEDASDRDPDMIISKLDACGSVLEYSTVIGGRGVGNSYPEDRGLVIIHTKGNRLVVSGLTGSVDFPVSEDAWDDTMFDYCDVFLMDFDISLPPSSPNGISAREGDGYLNISWGPPDTDGGLPIEGYQVLRGPSEDELEPVSDPTVRSFYNDTEVEVGRSYYYAVHAFNRVGPGRLSETVSALARSSPGPPQFFQVLEGNGCVKLAWEEPVFDGACLLEGYRVHRWSMEDGATIVGLDASTYRYTDEDVVNGKAYAYHLTAWNMMGESQPTQEKSVVPLGGPSSPTGLSVRNGPDSVVLTWEAPGDDGGSEVLFYRVYIGTFVGAVVQWRYADAATTDFTDTMVEIGVTYRYFVTAVNSKGESEPSEEVVGIPQSEPSPPEDLRVSEGNSYLLITWDEPSFLGGIELRGYRIYRSEEGAQPELIAEPGFDEIAYNDRNVTNGVRYSYWMTAFNDHGQSGATEEVLSTPANVPSAPFGLSLRLGDRCVMVSWMGPVNDGGATVLEFMVFRKGSIGELKEMCNVPVGTSLMNDSSVEAGATYTYAVKARNRMGTSMFSEKATIIALMPPGPPTNISLVPGDGSVEVRWNRPVSDGGSPVTGFVVRRAVRSTGETSTVAELGQDALSFKDLGVENGKAYAYAVMAVNGKGNSTLVWSDPIVPIGAPGTPGQLTFKVDGRIVTIGWTAPLDDGGSVIWYYRIYRSPVGGRFELIGIAEPGSTTFVDGGPKDHSSYEYAIVAVNGIGESRVAARGTVDIEIGEASSSFVEENLGLLITVPAIIVLSILLLAVLFGRRKEKDGPCPVPCEVSPSGQIDPATCMAPTQDESDPYQTMMGIDQMPLVEEMER